MEFLILPVLLAAGYLLGSMSFSIMIVERFFSKDIRDYGSGNAGMTNVLRNFGKWPAVFTFVFDFLKGAVSALLGLLLCTYLFPAVPAMLGAYAGGIGAVVGHLYPVYYHFKGGKGVTTSIAVILVISPLAAAAVFSAFLIVFLFTKMVSAASIAGAVMFPLFMLCYHVLYLGGPWWSAVLAALMGATVIIKHRANIKRIVKGTEYQFGQKNKTKKN